MAAAAATAKPAAQTPPRRREPDAQPQPEQQHLLTPAAAEPASGGTTTIGTRHVARIAIAPLAAGARAALVKQAAAVHKAAAGRQKEAAIDAFLCRTLPREWSPEHALMVLQNSCAPLDSHSRASVRAAFFKEENGYALERNGRPPPESLWPGTRARPSCKNIRPAQPQERAQRSGLSLPPWSRSRAAALPPSPSLHMCSRRLWRPEGVCRARSALQTHRKTRPRATWSSPPASSTRAWR